MVKENKNAQSRDAVENAYGTGISHAVSHPSSIQFRRCSTSVIRRERVCSSYGRRHDSSFLRLLLLSYVSAHLPGDFVLLFRAL